VADDPQKVVDLEQWLRLIEKHNDITRHFLMVQWQEVSAPLPAGTDFPSVWPPRLRRTIELVSRPIGKTDVEAVLAEHAVEPLDVLVTPDPNGLVGWTPIDAYFIT
jgi:hypothetical protein